MGNQFSRSNSTKSNKRVGGDSSSNGTDTLRPNKQQKMIIPDAPSNICSLPDPLLVNVSEYLALPSRALFAVSLHTDGRDISDMRTRMNVQTPDLLDFGDLEKELAMRLTDQDLGSILNCIGAKDNLKKLKLTNCRGIIGHGLAPLRQSVVIEQIDLSLVGKFESPILEGDILLSESGTLPILQSIVDMEGSVLKLIVFPQSWSAAADTVSQPLRQFIESYEQHLDAQRFCCASERCGRSIINRADNVHDSWISTHNNTTRQLETCYECGDMSCRECSDDFILDITHCDQCKKAFCQKCVPEAYCENECHYNGPFCSGCKPSTTCSNCEYTFCQDCGVDKCDVCEDGVCEGCQMRDRDTLRTCANCDRKLCYSCCKVQFCGGYECCEVICYDCQPEDWECEWCSDHDEFYDYRAPKVKCSNCFKQSRTHCCRCGKKKLDHGSYLSPTIPRSHWISQGYDETYAGVMEKFLNKLKVTTLMLKSGSMDGDTVWVIQKVI